jgi:hypothetical protein
MGFLSVIAQILLTIVGYSLGALAAARRKVVTPALVDIASLAAIIAAFYAIPHGLSPWVVKIAGIAAGFGLGLLLTLMRRKGLPEADMTQEAAAAGWLKKIRAGMKVFGMRMGNYNSRVMLAVFYLAIIGPFAILTRLLKNPIKTTGKRGTIAWRKREKTDSDIQSLFNQF